MRNRKPKNKVVRVNPASLTAKGLEPNTASLMARGPDANSRAACISLTEGDRSDEDILCEKLAARIRHAYIRERRRHQRAVTGKEGKYGSKAMPKWDGGRDDEGVNRSSVWLDVARHLLDMKCLSPERFVQAQFVEKRSPQPNMLKSEAAWDRFTRFNSDAMSRLKNEFKSECFVFAAQCQSASTWFPDYDKVALWRFVLKDLEVSLSALFRFCVAVSEDLGDVTAQFHELALREYLQDPDGYARAWGEYIPEVLKKEALNVLNKLERTPTCR